MRIMRLICDECFREEHEDDAEGWTERAGRITRDTPTQPSLHPNGA